MLDRLPIARLSLRDQHFREIRRGHGLPVPIFVLDCLQTLAVVIAHVDHDSPKQLPRELLLELEPSEWFNRLSHF